MPISTNEQVEARRDKVGRLTVKGFNAASIAKALNVSKRTIEMDKRANRKKWIKEFKKEPIEKLLHFIVTTNDEILKENWKVLESTADEKVKLEATDKINKFVMSRLKIMETMGVIEKIPEKMELSGELQVQQYVKGIKKVKEAENEKANV